jgi:energy-coupling factor transporter transmembrane protein EcfT
MKKKLSPVSILILFISASPLFLPPKLFINIFYLLALLSIFFYSGLTFRSFLILFLLSFFTSFIYIITFILNPDKKYLSGNIINIALFLYKNEYLIKIKIYEKLLNTTLASGIRLFSICLISFCSAYLIDIDNLIRFLMQRKVVSYQNGYAVSIAFQSISDIKREYSRVNYLMKARNIRPFYKGLLPLLVYGVRYAQLAAISLVARGFNEERSIFRKVDYDKKEMIAVSIISLIVFVELLSGWFVK